MFPQAWPAHGKRDDEVLGLDVYPVKADNVPQSREIREPLPMRVGYLPIINKDVTELTKGYINEFRGNGNQGGICSLSIQLPARAVLVNNKENGIQLVAS